MHTCKYTNNSEKAKLKPAGQWGQRSKGSVLLKSGLQDSTGQVQDGDWARVISIYFNPHKR